MASKKCVANARRMREERLPRCLVGDHAFPEIRSRRQRMAHLLFLGLDLPALVPLERGAMRDLITLFSRLAP